MKMVGRQREPSIRNFSGVPLSTDRRTRYVGLKSLGEFSPLRRHRQREGTVFARRSKLASGLRSWRERERESEEGRVERASQNRSICQSGARSFDRGRERELLAHDRTQTESELCQVSQSVSQSNCRYIYRTGRKISTPARPA